MGTPSSESSTRSGSTRSHDLPPFSQKAKARVDVATRDAGNRCLVTNFMPQHGVSYAHLLPRPAKNKELTKLEFAWGFRLGTLNVDTHLNVIRLREDIHELFDRGWFALLPDEDEIKKYMDGEKPDFDAARANNTHYNYTLIASEQMNGFFLARIRSPGESSETDVFEYPYVGFPTVQSHLHPCFAICHAGRFTTNLDKLSRGISPDLVLRLTAVVTVYSKWMAIKPDAAFLNNPKNPGADKRSEGDRGQPQPAGEVSPRQTTDELPNENNKRGSPSEGHRGEKRRRSDDEHD